ncbi:MAG TPA: hypothetical protein VD997_00360 [Phycisphaerales bacterium]|nr:hypothetical protein [Phycisphaerales bacterium]
MSNHTPRIIRSPRPEAVGFAQRHVGPFVSNAPLLGLSPQDAASYAAAAQEAQDALAAVDAAKQAWKLAAARAALRLRELNRQMTRCVEIIDLTAAASPDPMALYSAAELSPPNTPGVMAAPGECTGFRAQLNSDGSLTIQWKCKNPNNAHGTIYQVLRRLPAQGGGWNAWGEYAQLDLTAAKRFTDGTIPAGAGRVQYVVQARRGGTVGPLCAPFTVQLGAAAMAAGEARLAA